MTNNHWRHEVVHARIQDTKRRIRYAGGSPDPIEIGIYQQCLARQSNTGIGVVLGMTPELRRLAATQCDRLFSVDQSEAAIATYRDWLPESLRHKETIIHGDWHDLHAKLSMPANFILGDGIFGNVIPLANYASLLNTLRSELAPDGCFITRHCLMPQSALENSMSLKETLIANFRAGQLDEAEFGLTLRLQGYLDRAYTFNEAILDNAIVFSLAEKDYQAGILTNHEYQAMQRYFFDGLNTLPSTHQWEQLLQASDFSYQRMHTTGKLWYDYYPVYWCKPQAH